MKSDKTDLTFPIDQPILPGSREKTSVDAQHIGYLLLRLVELERERELLLSMMDDAEVVSIRLPLSGRMPIR